MLVRRLAVVGLVLGSVALVAGCASEVEEESVGQAESAWMDGEPGTCEPRTQTYTRQCGGANAQKQRNVTAALANVMGGPPAPACSGLATKLQKAREKCTLGPAYSGNRCGLAAGLHTLSCYGLNESDKAAIFTIGSTMDACWGAGSSGLWAVQTMVTVCRTSGSQVIKTYDITAEVDPEPARIAWGLNGGTTTAAATYINSGAPTSAVRWPAGWTYNTSLAGGTACAALDVPAQTVLYSAIQASGNYRRCL
jgi:hypothetical protein